MVSLNTEQKFAKKNFAKKKFAKKKFAKKIEPAHVRRYYKTYLNTGPVLQVKVPNNIGKKTFSIFVTYTILNARLM